MADGWEVNALYRGKPPRQSSPDAVSLQAIRAIHGDIEDSACLDRATEGIDVVFHAAAKVHSVPRTRQEEKEFYRINVDGTEKLLRACQRQPLRAFIFFSTIAVYGPDTEIPMQETTPCRPEGAYAVSKFQAEERVLSSGKRGMPASVLRLGLVYGEAERGNFLRMVRSIDRGRFLFVGSLGCKKSMTYVENVIDAALLAAENPLARGEIFNLADPSPYPLKLVVETVAKELGVSLSQLRIPPSVLYLCGGLLEFFGGALHFHPPFTPRDVKKLTSDTICDVTRIESTLGFKSRIGLEEGVRRTVHWYRGQQEGRSKRL